MSDITYSSDMITNSNLDPFTTMAFNIIQYASIGRAPVPQT